MRRAAGRAVFAFGTAYRFATRVFHPAALFRFWQFFSATGRAAHVYPAAVPNRAMHQLPGLCQAFLRFAAEEPELFRLLYLRRRNGEEKQLEDVNEERIVRLLSKNLCMAPERARQMHRRMQATATGWGL